MVGEDKVRVVVKLGQLKKIDDLCVIVENFDVDEIKDICIRKVKENDLNQFLNYLLQGFTDTEESKLKRFEVVKCILDSLNTIELNTKSTLDVVTRLYVELDKFSNDQIVAFVEDCIQSIRRTDSKTTYWKDLLPQLILLVTQMKSVQVSGIEMSGSEYRSAVVKNICTLEWRIEALTPIGAMFKELLITKEEREIIITKLCENIFQLGPTELPANTFQLFGLCNNPSLIIIPILFLQKYFNKYYYSKEYSSIDSNTTAYDSIEIHSHCELQDIQETIFFHLGNCTEFKMNEKDVVFVFRNLATMPHYLLTPWMISALLTLSKVNRQPEVVRLSSSDLLPFIRRVVQNNESEREMVGQSLWCRQTFDRKPVDLDKIMSILIDQSINGMEVVTPGLIALAFTLLKAKQQPQLNQLGITFLQSFLKKRYIFGQGILKQLAELLFANQDSPQFAECLNTLSLTNTLTISECVQSVQSILNFLLLIPGHHAMRMITFVYPLIKISFAIRDSLIEVLTKAMNDGNSGIRTLGVYGFCMLLKNLKNNNSTRRNAGHSSSKNLSFTQASISGFSLMSQSTLGNRDNPQRHFDMLALEIIGILRKCFNETHEMKEILYEGLTRAIEFNPKLTSHLLIFMDWHFRSYFEVEDQFEVKFHRVVSEHNGHVDVWDNLGKLITFIGTCVITCDQNNITHDNSIITNLLECLLRKCDTVTLDQLDLKMDLKSKELGTQLVQFVEGVMAYAVLAAAKDNDFIEQLVRLFKHHQKVIVDLKSMFGDKKGNRKGKIKEKPVTSTPNTSLDTPLPCTQDLGATINHQSAENKDIIFKPSNIWEINTIHRLLVAVFSDHVPFANKDQLLSLKDDLDFKKYLVQVTIEHVQGYRHLPDYRHVKHSRRMFVFLMDVTEIIYNKCIKQLSTVDELPLVELCVELFLQCMLTANDIYKRKLDEFFKRLGHSPDQATHVNVYNVIETIYSLLDNWTVNGDRTIFGADIDSTKIQRHLLQCLELLYPHLPPDEKESAKAYNWLYNYCLNNTISNKQEMIHSLLFTQRIKHHDGEFFQSIAIQLSQEFGTLTDLDQNPTFQLKTITESTADSCFLHLMAILKKDLEDVEYMVLRAKSLAAKIKYLGDKGVDDDHVQALKTMERSICAHLIHIVGTLIHLSNAKVPLGNTTDLLVKLLTQFYICVTNVTKHLIIRNSILGVIYTHIKFDKLIQISGKPLASRIYDFITYIDQNILPDEQQDKDAQMRKKKILRETRSLPKLIRWIETLHKYILLLGRKVNNDISHYLHLGIVRDFRIQPKDLAKAIRSNENDGDEMRSEDDDNIPLDSDKEDESTDAANNDGGTAKDRIMHNVAKIKKKASEQKPKASVAGKGKRRRQVIVNPEAAATNILKALDNVPMSPTRKKPRRSSRK